MNIESLGRTLYPELNLWDTAQPYLEQWLKDRYSPGGLYKRASKNLPAVLEQLPRLPEAIIDSLRQSGQQHQLNQQLVSQLNDIENRHQQTRNRQRGSRFALLFLLVGLSPLVLDNIQGLPVWSWALLAVAAVLTIRR